MYVCVSLSPCVCAHTYTQGFCWLKASHSPTAAHTDQCLDSNETTTRTRTARPQPLTLHSVPYFLLGEQGLHILRGTQTWAFVCV